MIPDLLTAKEARKILRLGKNAIYDLARQRKLEYVKIGGKILFPREAIEKFIRQNTIPAARNYFSMNRLRFRQYPGSRSIEPDHEEFSEGINQDSPHCSSPIKKIDHSLTKGNPNKLPGLESESERGES
ncbi:MAG: helix-turn-helix domain-containing protein [Candidatus Aminicenantes bacterium]|nr:helix-turn-helix domain-containing protein [Candidatus Aminicenantes bacterium]